MSSWKTYDAVPINQDEIPPESNLKKIYEIIEVTEIYKIYVREESLQPNAPKSNNDLAITDKDFDNKLSETMSSAKTEIGT